MRGLREWCGAGTWAKRIRPVLVLLLAVAPRASDGQVALTALADRVASAARVPLPKIIGIGESAHGSATLQVLGFALAKRFITDGGVSDVVLEGSDGALGALANAVERGQGSVVTALNSQRYPIWKTQESAEFFEWLRDLNLNRDLAARVRVHGNDIQNPNAAHAAIVGALRERVPAIATRAEVLLSRIDPFVDVYFDGVNRALATTLLSELTQLIAEVEALPPDSGEPDAVRWAAATRRLRAYQGNLQAYSSARSPRTTEARQRSLVMTELTTQIVKRSTASVLLFMHAGHVARERGAVGGMLARLWGKGYLPIGLFFGEGEVATFRESGPIQTLNCSLPRRTGTLEGLLGSGRTDTVFVLRETQAAFNQPIAERAIGFGDASCGSVVPASTPRQRYEVLMFAARGTASRPITRRSESDHGGSASCPGSEDGRR